MFGVSSLKSSLKDDEYITQIEGNYSEKFIHRLQIKTSKKQTIQVGTSTG